MNISTLIICQGDSGGPVVIPVVTEKQKLDKLDEKDLYHLSLGERTIHYNLTKAEVMDNIVRDPILIGVTRYLTEKT